MSSLRRIEASRSNGSQSHGPASSEGKARSAQNARTHALTASIVLANESNTQLEALLDAYTAEFQPATATELDLIEEMATGSGVSAASGTSKPPSWTTKWKGREPRSPKHTNRSTNPPEQRWPSAPSRMTRMSSTT